MLQRNEEILIFEFLRSCSKANRNNGLVTVADFESSPAKTLLPDGVAIAWAVHACSISVDSARQLLRDITSFANVSDRITFTQFILFAVKCFVLSSNAEEDNWKVYLNSAKLLIESCAECLNRMNFLLGVNVLDQLLSRKIPRNSLTTNNLQSIYTQTLCFFNQRWNQSRPGDGNTPPRPPDALWDAPRWIEFLKFIGFRQTLLNLYGMWQLFGTYLRSNGLIKSTSQWANSIVPPSPLLISTEHIMELLRSTVRSVAASDGKATDDEYLLDLTLANVLPAMIVTDDELQGTGVRSECSSKKLSLEDILRFGGDNVVHALQREDSFLRLLLRRTHVPEGVVSDELTRQLTVGGTFPASMLFACVER